MTGARIAVIKLGSLGDVVLAMGPMKAIRDHHKGAHLTLITTAPYGELARQSGYFDDVWTDGRPRRLSGLLALVRRMRQARFDRVYDLQTSGRSSNYFWALWPRLPEWSGIAVGASHRHNTPERVRLHTVERQAQQLKIAGIDKVPLPDLSFAHADLSAFALPARYGVLVPGGSAHRPRKRWPAERYGELAQQLLAQGITPVIVGGEIEAPLAAGICAAAPGARDLTGRTTFAEVAALARAAALAVGNDTGPMHLLAAAGCPSLVLFSDESDPALCAPRGPAVKVIQVADLGELDVATVAGTARELIATP